MRGLLLLSTFLSSPALARPAENLSEVAGNLSGFTQFLLSLAHTFAVLLGMAFLFGALVQYQRHRQSSAEVPLGRVLSILLLGILLLGITLVPQHEEADTSGRVDSKTGVVVSPPKLKR